MQTDNVFTNRIIQQVKNGWAAQNKRITEFFNKFPDEAYQQQIAPGKNRIIYIFGHLISTSDGIIQLFGLGERLFPEFEALFVTNPDDETKTYPQLAVLKENWNAVNAKLSAAFEGMTAEDWMSRHTKVSAEDFAQDPLRNKLNVLISRTSHMNYHLGQLNISPLIRK
jgi:hypothetical protein